jgi:aspartyl-tRNA(Asn)/glutamyl-tRNA(Gln) amidotransferase subunit A
VILAPTTPTASFPLGSMNEDPLTMYLNDVFAVPASLAGLPAMSVPATINADGLPLGLQLVGRPFDEQSVLDAGLAIQQRAGFTAAPEKWW